LAVALFRPHNPFPLEHQQICTTNQSVHQLNLELQQWRSQGAQLLAAVSAFTELIIPLSNCAAFSECQQLNFIERINTPDLPRNGLHIHEGDPFILRRNIDARCGMAKGPRCRAIQMRNQTVILQLDDDKTLPEKCHRISIGKYTRLLGVGSRNVGAGRPAAA
jgi:hypothetical protein